jgi:hypothetical protein
MGKIPDLMVYGDEDAAGWFGTEDLRFVRMVMPRIKIPFSATKGRELLLSNDEKEWQQWHNLHIHKYYSRLREILLRCPYYQNKSNELTKT